MRNKGIHIFLLLACASYSKAVDRPVALVFEGQRYLEALSTADYCPAAAYFDFVGCDAPDFCSSLPDGVRSRVVATVGQPKNISVLKDLPGLQLVQSTSYMYPRLTDVPSHAIVASYMPAWRDGPGAYGVEPIAEFVIAAVFDWNYRLREKSQTFATCAWGADAPKSCPPVMSLTAHPVLTNQTIGIMGYGEIGQAIARRSAALGMRTIATKVHGPFSPVPTPLTWLSNDNDELLRQSDFVAVTVPGSVHNIINRTSLALMKPNAVLIPISAGPQDYDALYDALVKKTIGGAVIDVWPHGCWNFPDMECGPPYGSTAEPYTRASGQPISQLDNVIALPGMAMRDIKFWEGSVEWVGQNLKALALKDPLKGVIRNATADESFLV